MFISTVTVAESVRHVVWNKQFISIVLPVGQDKLIEVCSAKSEVGQCQTVDFTPYMPKNKVADGTLKQVYDDGTVYLHANAAFSPQLASVKLHTTRGQMIFLRVSASKTATDDRLQILLPHPHTDANATPDSPSAAPSLSALVQWVAQQLYAPKRLLTQPSWIYRVPMHSARFVPLYRGAVISSMPLASWRSGDYYVTAVLLRNTLHYGSVHLQYVDKSGHSLLRGAWIAASFFRLSHLLPTTLTALRTTTDSTTAILISSAPFSDAIKEVNNG